MAFKPNRLMYSIGFYPHMLKKLKPWQLLVAVCHFGPNMDDCVRLDYSYTLEDGVVYCDGQKLDEMCVDDPMEALTEYAEFDWKKWALERLLEEWVK